MSTSFNFTKNKKFLDISSAIGIALKGIQDVDVLAAITTNKKFPTRKIEIGSLQFSASTNQDISFGTKNNGKVKFSGSASAFAGLGVYPDPKDMLKALRLNESFNDNLADGLLLEKDKDANYLALRWGYDLRGSVQGSLALGAPGGITFGVDGSREGVYAVVRKLTNTMGATDAIQETVSSWMMPSHVSTFSDLEPGTWLIAEVDGSVQAKIGAKFGYDFNWVREAKLGGLEGDIGLRVQLGVDATLNFFASGNYAVVISRESDDKVIRLQLFKMAKKGLGFSFHAGAEVGADFTNFLPDSADDFVAAVFGVHGAQIVKDLQILDKWTDPNQDFSEIIAGLTSEYTQKLVKAVTGIDPKTEFEKARGVIRGFLKQWNELDHRVATLLWKLVEEKVDLADVRKVANLIANGGANDYKKILQEQLKTVDFFNSPVGRWLESVAVDSLMRPLNSGSEFEQLQLLARRTLGLLDGSTLENVLSKLQDYINKNLHIDQITKIVNETSFKKLDGLLQAKMAAFLGEKFDFSNLNKIKDSINLVLSKRILFYEKALEALNHQYEFSFAATYQSTTTKTALLDISFDFSKSVGDLLARAIDGDFDSLLITPKKGVTLNTASLTHGIKRQSHVEVTIPFFKFTSDHFNESLARVSVDRGINAEQGRVLVYELDAHDEVLDQVRGKSIRDSSLTIGATLHQGLGDLRVHSKASFSYEYSLRQAVKGMRSDFLLHQLRPSVNTYFSHLFNSSLPEGHTSTLDDWIADSDKAMDQIENNGTGNFGNTLITLNVSLPGEVGAAWLTAPKEERSTAYMRMSRNLQARLKEMIPFCHFEDADNYKNIDPAAALLMYAAMPVTTNIRIQNGTVQFNRDEKTFWDFMSPDEREAMIESPQAAANLMRLLEQVHQRLSNLPGFGSTAKFYEPGQQALTRIASAAISSARNQFHSLLFVEATMIHEAVQTGRKLAEFVASAEEKPSDAIQFLAEFGAKVTQAFHGNLRSIYGGNALRPLGAMIFLEAARVLDPLKGEIAPTATLQLSVLKQALAFPPAKFPLHKKPKNDELLLQEMLVNL